LLYVLTNIKKVSWLSIGYEKYVVKHGDIFGYVLKTNDICKTFVENVRKNGFVFLVSKVIQQKYGYKTKNKW